MTTSVKHLIKFIFPEKSICDICSFKVCVQRSEELKVGVGLGGGIFGKFLQDGFLKVVKVWGEHFFCVFIPFYSKSLYPLSSTSTPTPCQIAPLVQCGVSWLLRISSSVIELVTDGNIQSFINIQLFNVVWLVTLFMLFNEFDYIRVKYFKWVCTPYEKNNMKIFSCDIERLLNHYAKFSQSSLGLWCIIF